MTAPREQYLTLSPHVRTEFDTHLVMFGLEHQFSVRHAERTAPDAIKVLVELTPRDGPCPACGVLTPAVKERLLSRLKDLPAAGQRVELWRRQRRLAFRQALCPRRSFTSPRPARRCDRVAGSPTDSVKRSRRPFASSNRAGSYVAAEYGVSRPTAHQALIAAAARWQPAPTPTRVLEIDQNRFRTVRWILHGITWTAGGGSLGFEATR